MLENPWSSVTLSEPLILSFCKMSVGLYWIVAGQCISKKSCVIFKTLPQKIKIEIFA